jgi:membrane-bound lytic murein transglycosylase F
MSRALGIGVTLFAFAIVWQLVHARSAESVNSTHWTNQYDGLFRKYAKHYFGVGYDWRWFKAQGIAESGLRADAMSKAGARGIMQILPSTFAEIRKANPHYVDIETPRWNIAAGIYYDRKLYQRWKAAHKADRLYFAFASYNAGYFRVLKASRKVEDTLKAWTKVQPHTPPQTRHYVKRIKRLMSASG